MRVTLLLNAGLMVDLPNIAETGAAGIGLFRTELQFMISPALPRARASSSRSTRRCSTPPTGCR